mmetsp:Transcript_9867/g.10943  ORF Transcript_9867/g.10943 Transcript_9867/m.10943 type:complete len:658 (-) Transcript_9867:109-2082(-)
MYHSMSQTKPEAQISKTEHPKAMLERLMQLKEMYNSQKQVAEVVETPSVQGDSSKMGRRKKRRGPDTNKLLTVVKIVLEKYGGSCHFETLAASVNQTWPSKYPHDNFGVSELKRSLKNYLFNQAKGHGCAFVRDPKNDGHWKISDTLQNSHHHTQMNTRLPSSYRDNSSAHMSVTHKKPNSSITATMTSPMSGTLGFPQHESRVHSTNLQPIKTVHVTTSSTLMPMQMLSQEASYESLTSCIERAFSVKPQASLDFLHRFVLDKWRRRPLSNGNTITDMDIKNQIRTTLDTNPKFSMAPTESRYPEYVINQKRKRKPRRRNSLDPTSLKKRRLQDNASSRPRRSASIKSTAQFEPLKPPIPPPGTECADCGKLFTNHETWYHGPESDHWACTACGRKWCQQNACPISGYVYNAKDRDQPRDQSRDSESDHEPPSWIGCDSCGAWVVAECDGITIDELSLYDDDSPNPLTYNCPQCRGEIESRPLVFYTSWKQYFKLKESLMGVTVKKRRHAVLIPDTPLAQDDDDLESYSRFSPTEVVTCEITKAERELFRRFPLDVVDLSSAKESNKSELAKLDKEFAEDIRKLRNRMQDLRKKLQDRNSRELKAEIEQLKKEKETMDALVEENLVKQFTSYFKSSREIFIQQKAEIVKSPKEPTL